MASHAATADNRFDVAAFIDAQRIGAREITMLVVCSVVLFIDGFDMKFSPRSQLSGRFPGESRFEATDREVMTGHYDWVIGY